MQLSSKFIEAAVEEMASLPGIGRKSALRLVLTLVKRDEQSVRRFAKAFTDLKENICLCSKCYTLSDESLCNICRNPNRDGSTICVVEDVRDVLAIENTHFYKGMYHVLGGRISPMDGIGPDDLQLQSLFQRMEDEDVNELILALSPTMEGETTSFYIYRKLKDKDVILSTIAKGIGVGTELEYADELSLGRSIEHRTPFEASLHRS
jgi:recombination protein RecR